MGTRWQRAQAFAGVIKEDMGFSEDLLGVWAFRVPHSGGRQWEEGRVAKNLLGAWCWPGGAGVWAGSGAVEGLNVYVYVRSLGIQFFTLGAILTSALLRRRAKRMIRIGSWP